ncbi:ArsR family transcriptional regulator [Cryobacterium flavum]|uniref:ArsR family transcriptional regulator n=1 Tax=Cryobacterium flavum TaxID=1424659 RepID=A0A5E9FZ37_9MICO|nr:MULTISPECIES: metalloregulator ArsR/SmtB family transcription factor [Cryobacterium]SDN40810.1 ArsR family transcriptional regulator [Cryobacterium flavum]
MSFTQTLPLTDISRRSTDEADACSSPQARATLAPDHADALARSLKALADPARLRIISIVSAHTDQEACVCDLTDQLTLSQPTISHHLKVLVEAGFLARAKRGTWSYYSLVPGSLNSVAGVLAAV